MIVLSYILSDLTFKDPCIVRIFQYISNKIQRYTVILSGNCSTCFGWYLHPSSGTQTTVSTTSGICHTVTVVIDNLQGTSKIGYMFRLEKKTIIRPVTSFNFFLFNILVTGLMKFLSGRTSYPTLTNIVICV